MLPFCLICSEYIPEYLTDRLRICRPCHTKLERAETSSGVVSVFAYEGAVRKLILRAKIENDPLALEALTQLFCQAPEAQRAAQRSTHILAAPSSLWGRLRGRTDLAAALALALARTSDKPLIQAPSSLFWRWSKRAQEKNRTQEKPLSSRWGELLVVDDIVTTGYTLHQVKKALKGSQLGFLTLAQAR